MDDIILFIVECGFYCGCGRQCASCIVSHKVDSGERNLENSRVLLHAGICDCI